mmetsp:Transcript_20098/g.60957  ORF Transcript_20098/g.60957 Transcript_20098/m.60957 type:complete len:253 (-) Transcript_20098:651-1409(-)
MSAQGLSHQTCVAWIVMMHAPRPCAPVLSSLRHHVGEFVAHPVLESGVTVPLVHHRRRRPVVVEHAAAARVAQAEVAKRAAQPYERAQRVHGAAALGLHEHGELRQARAGVMVPRVNEEEAQQEVVNSLVGAANVPAAAPAQLGQHHVEVRCYAALVPRGGAGAEHGAPGERRYDVEAIALMQPERVPAVAAATHADAQLPRLLHGDERRRAAGGRKHLAESWKGVGLEVDVAKVRQEERRRGLVDLRPRAK